VPGELPGPRTGKQLNPKTLILQNEEALLAGRLDAKLADVFGAKVLWQCRRAGPAKRSARSGVEHLPLIIGARRGLASNGEAPAALAAVYNHLERAATSGASRRPAAKVRAVAGVEIFDAARHGVPRVAGLRRAFEADFRSLLRSLFDILRASRITFGVLARERCTGDVREAHGQ